MATDDLAVAASRLWSSRADDLTTAGSLIALHAELDASPLPAELVDDIVRDAARALVRGEAVLTVSTKD